MSELTKFMFQGLPVRGAHVRLTDAWTEILRRRANHAGGAWAPPLRTLLGEMTAAGVLMHSSIKFDGTLLLQIQGDGPVKLAVAEVNADSSLRATATVQGEVLDGASLPEMVNVNNEGRCAITLDPRSRQPGQQAYQGVVPLFGDRREKLTRISDVLAHYMLQSEQLDTTLVLAANDSVAAGLLLQRMPATGGQAVTDDADAYNRLSILAQSLQPEELLNLEADTVLHRLYWQEPVMKLELPARQQYPRFACTCSRERVGKMMRGLGLAEVEGILAEQGQVEVGCEFCGLQYRFDAVDAAQVFVDSAALPQQSGTVQ
ncbi:MAG: hypothetical protein RLZZ126_1662 [Pseudomonadota bacterium]